MYSALLRVSGERRYGWNGGSIIPGDTQQKERIPTVSVIRNKKRLVIGASNNILTYGKVYSNVSYHPTATLPGDLDLKAKDPRNSALARNCRLLWAL